MLLLLKDATSGRCIVRMLKIPITDLEMEAVKKAMPMLNAIRHLIPKALLSVVQKVEDAINASASET